MAAIAVEAPAKGGIFMTTNVTPFFALPENQKTLNDFELLLERKDVLPTPQPDFLPVLSVFIRVLVGNPAVFDKHCGINIQWIGKGYMQRISEVVANGDTADLPERLVDVFTASYRFLCELDFARQGDLSIELRRMQNFVHANLDQFSGNHKSQLVYASYEMPAQVLKQHLFSPKLDAFKSFEEKANKAEVQQQKLETALDKQSARIQRLEDALKQQETKHNFVGLVQGFEKLKEVKEKDKEGSFWAAVSLAFLMLLPLSAHLGFVLKNIGTIEQHYSMLLFSLPATLGIELILLYYFRVVLQNFRSIQTQLLQIDLRVSLCQFIQSYAEYSSKIKKDDASALERFEALIFSGLVGEGKDLPTTFDGLEQVAGLIKAVRDK